VSEENTEIVRRLITRVNAENLDAAFSDVAPGAELDWSASEAPDSGVYRGVEEWGRWFAGRREGLADARFDVTEVMDLPPDRVLVEAHMRGRGRASGAQIEALGATVWTIRDGRVTSATLYQTKEQALKAVGMED
jgi:ketosteroid isomerase-like protein